jgi:hypothetical protein
MKAAVLIALGDDDKFRVYELNMANWQDADPAVTLGATQTVEAATFNDAFIGASNSFTNGKA